ncbi:transcription factor Myb4 [Volvox carteri f. nagariensis]|uniref:Transcription factor Myb4 n=1 Tax=Volvox carteri f. nagariensis TaxID=3068 RepID=D8THA2_VOLCA|nr:transcription factor Myb4 [Volvox carteri f. nagariensis]EFJ53036.1 transcription factor Myb4 [Volvox carteri f. nagariensis]|eukprot:XP_002946041.1 transcription factor Myb4 [Volvox carteri f. nagariensis]
MAQWSAHEDEQLRKLVKEYGPKRWSVIASKLKTKGSKQCRRRWKNHLNADLKSGGWTADEDRILLEGHRLYGNKWTEIAKMVGGRTDNAVKNRYAALCKRDAKGTQRGGGAARGGRGGRKPRPSDSDGGASDVEMDDDSDDNEEAKRTSSSSASWEASPVRHTRGHASSAAAAEKAGVNSTPPRSGPQAAPSPPQAKAEAPAAADTDAVVSTGVRSSFLGRRRQAGGGGGGSPPLLPEPEAGGGPAKRRALLQSSGVVSAAAAAGGSAGGSGASGTVIRQPITTPQTPLVQVPQQMQQQPQESLITAYQHPQQPVSERMGLGARSGSAAAGAGAGRPPGAASFGVQGLALERSPPLQQQHQQYQHYQQQQQQPYQRDKHLDSMHHPCSSTGGGRETVEVVAACGQPKKLPLTINIPNAASAEPQAVQQPNVGAAVHGIEIRVLKDLLTPCEIQYARELNDMQLPLHINVDEDSTVLAVSHGGGCSLLGAASSEPPLTTSRQAAHNALTALFSPNSVAGGSSGDFNDVLKWFQSGFTPRSSCGDEMTPRQLSRMGLTPCGLSGGRGGGLHCVEEAGMLGTGLTPKCLLDSGSPRSHGGIGGLTPQMPELSAAKRARRQVEVAAAVAAAANETPGTGPLALDSSCGLGRHIMGPATGGSGVGVSLGGGGHGGSGAVAAAALGLTSPGGTELHAGHRQLLTKLIQTAAGADANGQGAVSSCAGGAAGDMNGGRLRAAEASAGLRAPARPHIGSSSKLFSWSRLAPLSPSTGMVTPEPLTRRGSLTRDLSGAGMMMGPMAAGAGGADYQGAGTSGQVPNATSSGGVVVMPYFTPQELMLLLEVLNSEDLQALPPPPPPPSQQQQQQQQQQQ